MILLVNISLTIYKYKHMGNLSQGVVKLIAGV